MKTKQTNLRLSIEAKINLQRICAESGANQTAAVEMALAKFAKEFKDPWQTIRANYRLDICTYPAVMGAPVLMRSSGHDTPEEAMEYLKKQDIPYAYANLLSYNKAVGYEPCNFDGSSGFDNWETILGENKNHPAYDALQADMEYLVDETIRRWESQSKRTKGMASIANELLMERHPMIVGWAERIAIKASENVRSDKTRTHSG